MVRPARSGDECTTTEVKIEFLTPTQIRHDGGIVEAPEFHHVVKRLRDRVNAIAWFFGGTLLDLDYAEFGKRAEAVTAIESRTRWHERERFSTRTHRRHSIGGFEGAVTYQGEIGEFLPLLRLGQWIHVANMPSGETAGYVLMRNLPGCKVMHIMTNGS